MIRGGDGRFESDPFLRAQWREDRLARLFERLRGEGRIKVYRVEEPGSDRQYAFTLHVWPDLESDIEEQVARACGGGAFELKAYRGRKYLATASILIDLPPKWTRAERRRMGIP